MESVDNKSLKILKVMRKNNMAYTNSQLEDVTPESINLEDIINSLRYLQNLEYIEKFQGGYRLLQHPHVRLLSDR